MVKYGMTNYTIAATTEQLLDYWRCSSDNICDSTDQIVSIINVTPTTTNNAQPRWCSRTCVMRGKKLDWIGQMSCEIFTDRKLGWSYLKNFLFKFIRFHINTYSCEFCSQPEIINLNKILAISTRFLLWFVQPNFLSHINHKHYYYAKIIRAVQLCC